MKNKKSTWLVLPILLIALVAGVTSAYFTAGRLAENEFTIGENTIEIEEDFVPPKKMEQVTEYRKAVRVSNTGSVPCFVRVFAEFSDSDIKDVSSFDIGDGNWWKASEIKDHLPDGWVYIPYSESELLGGFYYYTEPLDPGDETPYLFENIKTEFARPDDVRDYEIIISAESVQTADKNGVTFTGDDAYEKAWDEFLSRRGGGA